MHITYSITGNAHYLLKYRYYGFTGITALPVLRLYRYYGFTAIQTAVGAFPENNSVILGHFSMQESCFYTVADIPS